MIFLQIAALLYKFSADAQVPIPTECAQEMQYFNQLNCEGYTAEGPESACASEYFDIAAEAENFSSD